MALVINTNVASLRSQESVFKTQNRLITSYQRLSSGYRINTAADDAAGLGISESLVARIRSFSVAERNTNNAVSMATTAEGGLNQVSAIVVRMRELAVQAANGDLSSTDRGYINTEFQLLSAEIDRLVSSTEFNGVPLLGGLTTSFAFQVGINTTSADVITLQFGGLSVSGLGLSGVNVAGSTPLSASSAINSIDSAIRNVSTARANFGAVINRLQYAIANTQTIRNNLEAANSAIRDVDVAEETSQLARTQVLLQAGTAILAQANQQPQIALGLLGAR